MHVCVCMCVRMYVCVCVCVYNTGPPGPARKPYYEEWDPPTPSQFRASGEAVCNICVYVFVYY